jgi:hypothetical protein
VDGHWRRVGLPEFEVEEFNGTSEWWRCVKPSCVEILRAAADPACPGGMWRIPAGFRFQVDPDTFLTTDNNDNGTSCVGKKTSLVVGSAQPHDTVAFEGNHPRCVRCGGKARPAVKMFNDSYSYVEPMQHSHTDWLETMVEEVQRIKWGGAVGRENGDPGKCSADEGDDAERSRGSGRAVHAVVLEVGAGVAVRTLRHLSMRATREFAGEAEAHTTLIRINPVHAENEHDLHDGVEFLSLRQGALEALAGIEQCMVEIGQEEEGGGEGRRRGE